MAAITRSDLEAYTVVWTNDTTEAAASVTSSDLRTPETVAPSDSPWPSSDRRFSRVVIICLSLLFLLSSAGNLTVLYIIGQHLKWRAATNVFITVLSLSDLLLALTCVPMLFVSLVTERWVFGETGCTANVVVSRLLGLMTGAMTLLLTIDRHQTVVRLIRTKFVLRRTLAVVAVSCIASVALVCPWGVLVDEKTTATQQELFYRCTWGSLPVDHRVYDAVYQTVFFTGPVVFMFYCVLSLARTIRRNDVEVCPPSMHVTQLRFSGEIQTAKTVVVMVIVFAICRLPYSVIGYAGAISPSLNRVEMAEPAWTMTAQLISWASGAVNPFIYAVRNPNVAKILHLDRKAGYVSEEPLPADPSPGDRPGDAEAAIVGNSFSRSFRATKSAAAGITKCTSSGEVRISETSMNSADSDGKIPVTSCCSSVSPEVTSVYVRSASYDQSCVTGGGGESVCRVCSSSAGSSRSMSVPSVLNSVGARFVARNSLSSVSTTLTNVVI